MCQCFATCAAHKVQFNVRLTLTVQLVCCLEDALNKPPDQHTTTVTGRSTTADQPNSTARALHGLSTMVVTTLMVFLLAGGMSGSVANVAMAEPVRVDYYMEALCP